MRAGVALGSNLGDRLANLSAARHAISGLPGVSPPFLASSVFETEPIGCEPGATSFLNAAIEFSYHGEAGDLWHDLRKIEVELGRPARHERNVSRPIDLDLLYFGDRIVSSDALTLPHPRMFERAFVLQPLADIAPDTVLPGQTKTIRRLLASLPGSVRVERAIPQWEPT
jgi:2-amino-4-hydroxy-6-hydroxymethyldihydropteridine diphosphokinase